MQKIGIHLVYFLSCLKILQNSSLSVTNPLCLILSLTLYLDTTNKNPGFSLSDCTLMTLTVSAPL